MRLSIVSMFGAAVALSAGLACAQGRGATAAQARSYILSAFLTQAAPAVLSEHVKLGEELEDRLALPPGADSHKVYEALMAMTDNKSLDVRRATAEELASYGARPGLQPELPSYTLEAGDLKLVVQYDLEANNIPFVGQLGIPRKPVVVEARHEPEPTKPAVITLVWTEQFGFKTAKLTAETRAKLESDIVPKLQDFAEIRYVNVSGHADYLGQSVYNQRLSEQRAETVRDYLVAKGVDTEKIEVLAYGQTMPLKSCRDEKKRSALVACLAPNRRVQIEIQGTLK